MNDLKPAKADKEIRYGEGLDPMILRKRLWRYQRELGRKFGLDELLKVEDIRAKMTIAEAISQMRRFYGVDPEKEGTP